MGKGSLLSRYGIAVAMAAIAVLLRQALTPLWGDQLPFLTFFVAILLSARLSGLWAGLLTTFLCALSAAYLWLPPVRSLGVKDLGTLVGLGAFLLVGWFISHFTEVLHRARMRAEESARAAAEERERFQVTLASIGDAVIVTDRAGQVTFLNQAAETLTGWNQNEAVGKPLAEVFTVVNELTRQRVPDPVHQVLEKCAVVGLANHTLLISKDGAETPIDDSAAPVCDHQGIIIGVVLVFRDITARNQAERELSYLAAIVHSSEDVIIGKDLEGTILSWNAGAERTYGYKASEVIGRNISLIVPPERPDELPSILQRLRQGQAIDHYETERVRKDGRRILVALTISPIMDRSGRIIGASTIARDITERRQAQFEREQLLTREQQARRQAEIANRAKDQFLANLSHELRNPLNAILGWARLLRSGQLDEATAARGLEIIERNVTLQNQLVADLLDVSRIVTGKIHLDVRSVDLCLIIDEAINTLRLVADAKSIQLRAIMDAEAGQVAGDAARLQQVVWNLLSNAIKFTPSGGEVQVRLKGFNSHVEITVSDTGQGIDPEFLPFIFDRFRQEDNEVIRRHGGLGLGLSIVRHLVELHGGSVHAENLADGQGCAFSVKLPLQTIRTANEFASPASGPNRLDKGQPLKISPVLQGVRILVVDDDRDSCELLAMVLQQAGAQVRCTFSTREALAVLHTWLPDVLLADIGMPEEDGYTLIRKVRGLTPEQGGNIPAAALTAYARAQDQAQALAAGFQVHLSKPIEPSELIAMVSNLAEQAEKKERAGPL